MASDEEEDLAALRSAVLASMLQPKAAVIPKEEARPLAPTKSDSEDDEDDLAALRAAALLSTRKKSLENSQDSRKNSSDKFSNSRAGSNGTANLILVPPQNEESIKSLPARSKNRWGGSLNSSPASTPTKPNVGRKFSRLQRSDSDSDESEEEEEPIKTDTKKSDDELGSDVDIHLGFDAKEVLAPSPEIEKPPPAPVQIPVRVPAAVPVAVPEIPLPVRVKTEPQEMDDKTMAYCDIDERPYNYNQHRLNDFGNAYTDPVVIDEHGDVDMRRVESHLKPPPKLQIQVNMDGAGDRRRVQVADVGPVQQMFRVTVTNLNQQRNILLEGADGCLFHDGMGMQLAGRLRPIDDLSVLDARRMVAPRLEQERPKQLPEGEQYRNSGYWDTAEQFRKRKQSYEGQEVPWKDVNNYPTAHNKAIITDHYQAEKTTGKLYMDRESSKIVDREEKPKLRLIKPDHYSDSDSKTDSLLPAESVSTREHDIAVNAEYWVSEDQTTERVVKRAGKVKHKSGEKPVKRKSRSPRVEKVKTSKDSKRRSHTSKKRQPEPESSPDRYSGDESEITTSRDIKREQEREESFSESEPLSSHERSPSESDVKNSDTIDDESKYSDIYSEDVSSVSHKPSRPVSKKKNQEPQPPVQLRKNSGRSPKQVAVSPRKDKSPRGRKEVVKEHIVKDKIVKGRHARNDVEEFDRSKSRDRSEGYVIEHNHHAKEKNIRHKGDVEKVHRTNVERVRKSKMVYEEEDEEEKTAKPKKSCAARQVSDEESSPERPVKTKRSVKDVAGGSRDLPIKKKLIEAPVERTSRPKQRSPRKKLTPEPVALKRSPGNRMYRSRRVPEEEGEIMDEESEERICKPVKLRSKDQLKMREAIGECSRKLHELLRREDKEDGELDESPVEVNRKALKAHKEEKEEGELSEGPSERKRKVSKGQKLAVPDSDEEERLASQKLQKLRKDRAKGGVEPGDKVQVVADKKAKSKATTSEEQSAEKVIEKKTTGVRKFKTPEEDEKNKTGREICSEKSESGDKNDSDTSARSSKSKRSLEGKAAKSDVAAKVLSATEKTPVPEQVKTPEEVKKAGEKVATKKVDSGKAGKGKKTDGEESGAKWKKVGEGEEDRAMSPLQDVLEEANREVEDATKDAATAAAEEKEKLAATKFKKFQLEKPGVKKGTKSEEEAKAKAAPAKKSTEPKKLDKAGLKLSETKEKLLKILAQGKLNTQDAAKKAAGKPDQKDDSMNFSAGLEAIVQRKEVADNRKKITATKTVKKSATKRKKNISKSPVRKKSHKSSRSRHRDSRSRSRSSSATSYSDRRKSRHRRRHRYSSTESSRSRYSSTTYSRRSRSRSRRRSYSRRQSRSRSRSYSRRRSRSRSRRRSRSRKRSSSGSRSSSRTRSSSRSGSTSSTRSSSHSRSTRSSSSGSTSSSTSSASSKDSDDNAAWRFKHTGKSAKDGQTKSEIFERKRTDIEIEQKKKQNKNTIDKELPDDRRGNYNNRNDDRPWRGGHDFRYNNNNNNRGRFMYHDNNRPRFNDFGSFRGPGRYQRDWYPRGGGGGGGGFRDFRDYRQDNNFRDFRNQNRDRPPFIRRNRSWSGDRGSDKDASPERSRSKDKKDKPKRSKSRDDSKDTETKRSQSRESGAQTKTAGANKAKVNPPPKFDAYKEDKEKDKDHSDTEGSQQSENKRDKEKLPVHKRLGSQLGNVIPAKMNRRMPDNEPDPKDDKELEARIERIRQQNAKILQRRREVEQDKMAHRKKHEKRKVTLVP